MKERLIKWYNSVIEKLKVKRIEREVMVVTNFGTSFRGEVKYAEGGRAYVSYEGGSGIAFLDNPAQRKGEFRGKCETLHYGERLTKWYDI